MIHSFPPIVSTDTKILILGSMPGIKSLEQQQYYAHPRNLFWWLIANTFNRSVPESYQQKQTMIESEQLALWDVLRSCERPGSLDSAIDQTTEQANDIPGLLRQQPAIERILFNGQKSRQVFERHILKSAPTLQQRYQLITLPSSSPANARQNPQQKLSAWSRALL